MPRVTFKSDFEYTIPGRMAFIAYRAGFSGLIPTAHYEAALAKGAVDGNAEPAKAFKKAGGNSGQAKAGDQGSVDQERG